jgi:hypothetical protein
MRPEPLNLNSHISYTVTLQLTVICVHIMAVYYKGPYCI